MKTSKSKIQKIALAISVVISNCAFGQDVPGEYVGGPANSNPCLNQSTTWYLGGNFIIPTLPPNPMTPPLWNTDIGTCNDYPLILKANNQRIGFVTPSRFFGINNMVPNAALVVTEPGSSSYWSNEYTKIYGDVFGNIEASREMNLNFATGAMFKINEGSAQSNVNHFAITGGGYVGMGTQNPATKLQVIDGTNTDILCTSTGANGTSGLWAENGTASFGLRTDGSGIGYLAQNVFGPSNILSFKYNTSLNKGQVWIGKRPTTGSHVNFDFSAPKIVANEIFVFTTGTWADYVFDSNYKLPKLSEVEAFYTKNHHLPEVPTTKEVEENGVSVGEMNALLLKKIEELTLYIVELDKKIASLENSNLKNSNHE